MSRKLILSICALTFATLAPARSQTLIDFDTFPGGAPVADDTNIGTQYASLGVTFTQFEKGVEVGAPLASNDFGGAGSGNGLFNVQGAISPITNTNRTDIERIKFLSPASYVSFVTQGYGFLTTFEAYSPTGILLETINNTNGGLLNVVFASSNIGYIDALQSQDNLTFRIDNLAYTITAVPEPGIVGMFVGLSAMGGVFLRRRKMSRQSD